MDQIRGTLGRKVAMTARDNLDFFCGNLLSLMKEAGLSKRQLSLAICDRETYIDEVIAERISPDLGPVEIEDSQIR